MLMNNLFDTLKWFEVSKSCIWDGMGKEANFGLYRVTPSLLIFDKLLLVLLVLPHFILSTMPIWRRVFTIKWCLTC